MDTEDRKSLENLNKDLPSSSNLVGPPSTDLIVQVVE